MIKNRAPAGRKSHARTPFSYVQGPYYTYILYVWKGVQQEPIYVGRGRGRRIMSYFSGFASNPSSYRAARTHNAELTAVMAALRAQAKDIMPVGYDHFGDLVAAKQREKRLIARFGRADLGTGTLINRNEGG